jgi:hypothetical protein
MSTRKLAQRLLDATRFTVEWSGLTKQVPESHGRRKSKWVPNGQFRVTLNPAGAIYAEEDVLKEMTAALNRDIAQVLAGEVQGLRGVIEQIAKRGVEISTGDANTLLEAVIQAEAIGTIRSEVRTKDGEHLLALSGELVLAGQGAITTAERLARELDKVFTPLRRRAVDALSKSICAEQQ